MCFSSYSSSRSSSTSSSSIHSPPTEGLLVVPVGILLLLLCFYFTMHESTILATTFLSLLGLCGSCSGVFLAVMCVGAHSHHSFSLLRSPIAWRSHGLYKQKKGVIFLMGFLVMHVSWNTHACVSRTDFLGVKLLFYRVYISFILIVNAIIVHIHISVRVWVISLFLQCEGYRVESCVRYNWSLFLFSSVDMLFVLFNCFHFIWKA